MSLFRSPILVLGVLGALFVHVLGMYLPFSQEVLETKPVDSLTWLLALAVSATVIPAIELHKWWWKRRRGGAALNA